MNRFIMILIVIVLILHGYHINELKKAKSVLTQDKINTYEYLLVDHEKEINKLKKAIVNIDAKCYNDIKQGGNNAKN